MTFDFDSSVYLPAMCTCVFLFANELCESSDMVGETNEGKRSWKGEKLRLSG